MINGILDIQVLIKVVPMFAMLLIVIFQSRLIKRLNLKVELEMKRRHALEIDLLAIKGTIPDQASWWWRTAIAEVISDSYTKAIRSI